MEELPATEHAGNGRPILDEIPEDDLVARAHHGSLSHEERAHVEELLKSGELPCLVATSSLELGIDMGAVDLVIQVESPKSVTRGLQRIGRAGHGLGEVSKGRIFPKFRADLLECAVVAQRMRTGEIEETVIPRTRSTCSPSTWSRWRRWTSGTSTRSSSWSPAPSRSPSSRASSWRTSSTCSTAATRPERFAELRPRIVWDRTAGTIRGRKGARQLAVTNAGTIPDRGLYGVHLPDGRRVGELDEEMVYEARPGQTFLLGATTWRIEEITRDRVIVTPAPGVPGAVPFWRGDGSGARPSSARRSAPSPARRSRPTRPSSPPSTTSTAAPPRTWSPTCASSRRRPASSLRRDDRRRALPRRDRRLAPLRALALRRPRPRRLGPGAVGEDPRRARPRGRRDLVRRRDRHPPPRRRRAAARRPGPDRARRARGPGRLRALGLGAVRRPLPRERRPLAADPARLPGQAHAALAAAPEVPEPARGRATSPASRSSSRPTASACATSSTCRRSTSCFATCTRAASPWSRSRPRPPRRSPPRCSSTTSPPTCTRATRRTPSGAPRRWRSTATCCASCSARRSCAS